MKLFDKLIDEYDDYGTHKNITVNQIICDNTTLSNIVWFINNHNGDMYDIIELIPLGQYSIMKDNKLFTFNNSDNVDTHMLTIMEITITNTINNTDLTKVTYFVNKNIDKILKGINIIGKDYIEFALNNYSVYGVYCKHNRQSHILFGFDYSEYDKVVKPAVFPHIDYGEVYNGDMILPINDAQIGYDSIGYHVLGATSMPAMLLDIERLNPITKTLNIYRRPIRDHTTFVKIGVMDIYGNVRPCYTDEINIERIPNISTIIKSTREIHIANCDMVTQYNANKWNLLCEIYHNNSDDERLPIYVCDVYDGDANNSGLDPDDFDQIYHKITFVKVYELYTGEAIYCNPNICNVDIEVLNKYKILNRMYES